MNTIRVISSISFNTQPFFESVVGRLCKGDGDSKQILDWCHWVQHQPDSDQRKPHIHFVCKPSRRIDTNDLRKMFIEPQDQIIADRFARGEIKEVRPEDLRPLGCLPFQATASMRDWLLYAIHDYHYLFTKGQQRTVHYERADVKSTDPDYLAEQWQETEDPIQRMTDSVVKMLTIEQMTYSQVLQTGLIPPNMAYYFKLIAEGIEEPKTIRNGRNFRL